MSDKHAEKSKGSEKPLIPSGGTLLDSLARMTKIVGSASLDEQFKDRGTNHRFNIGPVEAARQMEEKIRNGRR